MAAIDVLVSKFFVADSDVTMPGEMRPRTSTGNRVRHLIDGANYFGALRHQVDLLKAPGGTGKFFYFTDWVLSLTDYPGGQVAAGGSLSSWDETMGGSPAFILDDLSGPAFPPFLDDLTAMATNTVDVRALVWVSPLLVSFQKVAEKTGYYPVNAVSLLSVAALRTKPGLEKTICLNVLAHPLGAMHLKFVVCGDDTGAAAFVSGIDFEHLRVDSQAHNPRPSGLGWHDVGIQVEGPAAGDVYGWFARLWNEQRSRGRETYRIGDTHVVTHVDGTPEVIDRSPAVFASPPVDATARVQVLRTAPQFHIALSDTDRVKIGGGVFSCIYRWLAGVRRPSLSFAENGIFEFRAAALKAVAHAEKYIYVEDQGFANQELMDAVRARMKAVPDLKVIMLHHADPADGPRALLPTTEAASWHLGTDATLTPRIAFYERSDAVVVHSKSWIVDDVFAIIGSANFFRRSFYTDGECSIAVIDEKTDAANFAVDFRKHLWGEHAGLDAARLGVLDDLDTALKIWDPTWGNPGAAPAALLPVIVRKAVPFRFAAAPAPDEWPWAGGPIPRFDVHEYDQQDGDSRLEY